MHFNNKERRFSVLKDIDNDGLWEILIAELKKIPISADSIVDMLVSKGAEFTISIREFQPPRGYSNKPDFKINVTTLLPLSDWIASLVTFDGDFNKDGRKDLIVRRSPTLCNIYFSSSTLGFYNREPQLQFEIPPKGRMTTTHLNNDSISDMYIINHQNGQITLFLSDTQKEKGS